MAKAGTGTVIKSCDCQHEYQDRIYGQGKRLMTIGKEYSDNSNQLRCTVCGKIAK